MNFLDKIIGGGIGSILEGASSVIDSLQAGKLNKQEAVKQLTEIADREKSRMHDEAVAEIGAKERILVAELQQGDAFTKRARPFVVYSGPLIVIAEVVMRYIAHFKGLSAPATPDILTWYLPMWAGYGSVYAWGRSTEKRASNGGSL
jgi:hypothetical protein